MAQPTSILWPGDFKFRLLVSLDSCEIREILFEFRGTNDRTIS